MKRGFLDLLDPSNDPEFFWQVISGPPCIKAPLNSETFAINNLPTLQIYLLVYFE
jgi:hypothetical protein